MEANIWLMRQREGDVAKAAAATAEEGTCCVCGDKSGTAYEEDDSIWALSTHDSLDVHHGHFVRRYARKVMYGNSVSFRIFQNNRVCFTNLPF